MACGDIVVTETEQAEQKPAVPAIVSLSVLGALGYGAWRLLKKRALRGK